MNPSAVGVSICVPAFNAAATIADTLASLIAQSFRDFEVIVVDDCSTDATLDVVRSFRDSRIRIIRNETNLGAGGNLDKCVRLGSAPYTAVYHADDVYAPDIVEKEWRYLEGHPAAAAVFTSGYWLDDRGRNRGVMPLPVELEDQGGWDREYDFISIFRLLLRDYNFLKCPTAMVRTNVYKEHVRRFDHERFGPSADLGMWLRILERYAVGILPAPLFGWRQTTTQWSSRARHGAIDRDHFFLVIDSYLAKDWVRNRLRPEDLRHLRWLETIDQCRRAISCMALARRPEARQLLSKIVSTEALRDVLARERTRPIYRYRKWWLVGLALRLLLLIPDCEWLRKTLYKIRYRRIGGRATGEGKPWIG